MAEKFKDLQIDGAFISELLLVPNKRMRLSLIRAPANEEPRQVSVVSDLEFNDVQSCQCGFKANPWLEIKSHAMSSRSAFLKEYLQNREGISSSGYSHFQIICDEGEINIIARDCTLVMVEEISHRGASE